MACGLSLGSKYDLLVLLQFVGLEAVIVGGYILFAVRVSWLGLWFCHLFYVVSSLLAGFVFSKG